MASKRRQRRAAERQVRKSCTDKFKHDSESSAIGHAISLRKKGSIVHAYPCKHCKGWHVGHNMAKNRKARLRRLANG